MRLRSSGLALCLVGALLGLMFVTQWRYQTSLRKDAIGMRSEELEAYSKTLEAEVLAMRAQARDLRTSLAALAEEQQEGAGLAGELGSVQAFLGVLPVRGPGITIVIEAAQNSKDAVSPVVQAEDLLRVINELKASGAEALSINGQRYINWTTITMVGNSLTVNNVTTILPAVVRAVGDPAILEAGLRLRGGVLDSLAHWGISASIKKEDDLTIPAYTSTFKYDLAKPTKPTAPPATKPASPAKPK